MENAQREAGQELGEEAELIASSCTDAKLVAQAMQVKLFDSR
jgi:hypothetical protein